MRSAVAGNCAWLDGWQVHGPSIPTATTLILWARRNVVGVGYEGGR